MGNTPNGFTPTWRARFARTPSGSSSPILADGKVYLSYTRPTPRPEGAPDTPIPGGGGTQDQAQQRMVADAKVASVDELPLYAKEKTYSYHDHIMLCMDAATGKTLWKTVVHARSINFNMTHKYWGAYNMTPAHGSGRVFATSTSGWVYAYDADSGEPLWERKLWEPPVWKYKTHISFQTALLAFDDKLIVPQKTWTCLDAASGKVLWASKTPILASVPSLWTHQGKRHLIVKSSREAGVDCFRASDGRRVWRLPINAWSGGKVVGPGGLSISGDTLLVNRLTEAGPTLAAYRLGLKIPQLLWELPDAKTPGRGVVHSVHPECVPVAPLGRYAFTADLRVLDLATGKAIDQTSGIKPMNGGYMQAMGNLVMTRKDGTHGGITAGFYQLDEAGKVIAASAPWNHGDGLGSDGKPVINNLALHTTSYHHPLYYPMADGRLFIRGGDGIYCWDLRKK
jgi:outer membrane protein assembly factor BamB